jgi:hypothetical protein
MDKIRSILLPFTWKTMAIGALVMLVISVALGASLGYLGSRQKDILTQPNTSQSALPLNAAGTGDVQGVSGATNGSGQSSISAVLQPAGSYNSADSASTGASSETGTALQNGGSN